MGLYVIAAAILAIAVIGGTLAFFTDETEKKTNEFTFGDVDIELEETAEKVVNTDSVYEPGEKRDDPQNPGFHYDDVLPGVKYSKKPVITVCATSSDAYIFAEITVTINNQVTILTEAIQAKGEDKEGNRPVTKAWGIEVDKNTGNLKYPVSDD